MKQLGLLAIVALVLACGLLRPSVARQRYLQQMFFDYRYPESVEQVWPAAMAVVKEPPTAGTPIVDGREFSRSNRDDPSRPYDPGVTVRAVATDGGTLLTIQHATLTAGMAGNDLRDYDLELQVLKAVHPELADKLVTGAAKAAARER